MPDPNCHLSAVRIANPDSNSYSFTHAYGDANGITYSYFYSYSNA
jgi:hypothetical protein